MYCQSWRHDTHTDILGNGSSTLDRSKDLQTIYPYVDIALRIFLYTPATN
jgi:hypothetical protein